MLPPSCRPFNILITGAQLAREGWKLNYYDPEWEGTIFKLCMRLPSSLCLCAGVRALLMTVTGSGASGAKFTDTRYNHKCIKT